MVGGIGVEVSTCPECGSVMWNGLCENKECKYHWHTEEEEEEDDDI